VAYADVMATDRRRPHVAAPHTEGDARAVEMASAAQQEERPRRSSHLSGPSTRPSQESGGTGLVRP
jgi:hypothetical protein